MKPRVMLDLDGTVYHWERTARYLLRRHYKERGVAVPAGLHSPSTHYDYISDHVDKEAWRWLWSEGVARGLFRYGHIYTGASECVHALSEFSDLVVMTKRPANAVLDTMDWLVFQRWPVTEVHTLTGRDDEKSSIKPECDVYIDDSTDVIYDLIANTSGHVIIPDRPWNNGIASGNSVMRCFNWDEVVREAKRVLL